MTKYVHIVQVHPVENGKVNLTNVTSAFEYDNKTDADSYVVWFNDKQKAKCPIKQFFKAVYLGRVNDTTGELE